ncbi:MAG: type VI secretion system ImpA family N-terminal domain-containing protein, partial [Holosporales bacterium]|nr:type VI secretion system ImpA family N-terminal domain-containing protein [Holosporales bacterium]
MTDIYTIDDIVAEIPDSVNGVGSDLSLTSVYDDIKRARFEEDDGLSLGVWERELKKADWRLVEKLTMSALKNKTKDLQILAWFIEATVVLHGFSKIPLAIEFLSSFIESFWTSCYPKTGNDESDFEYKFRILDWTYEMIAKRVLFIPFAELESIGEKSINLYQYDYALEIKMRQVRSPKHSEE